MGFRHRHYLSTKNTRKLLENLSSVLRIDLSFLVRKKTRIEVAEVTPSIKVYLLDGKPGFFNNNREIFPCLLYEKVLKLLPSLIVDRGAIPHICNGADIMAPGIIKVEGEFEAGSNTVIRDEDFHKALSVSRTIHGSKELSGMKSGKVAKNVHYVGDRLWRMINANEFT